MIEVAAFMITINFFASAETLQPAIALGVSSQPAKMSTWSRTTNSCASRLAVGGSMPPTSLRMISIVLPATLSPCYCM